MKNCKTKKTQHVWTPYWVKTTIVNIVLVTLKPNLTFKVPFISNYIAPNIFNQLKTCIQETYFSQLDIFSPLPWSIFNYRRHVWPWNETFWLNFNFRPQHRVKISLLLHPFYHCYLPSMTLSMISGWDVHHYVCHLSWFSQITFRVWNIFRWRGCYPQSGLGFLYFIDESCKSTKEILLGQYVFTI